MIWKRILLFSLLFFILVFGLFYYVLPNVLHPLRIDPVPPSAYVVPWMRPGSSFEQLRAEMLLRGTFDIDTAMAKALKLNMTFRISMWDGTTRVIPSTVYLGHDSQCFYIGGKFVGMYSNPASEPGNSAPNRFQIYFDTADRGVLEYPESGSDFGVQIAVPEDTLWGWQYHDVVWAYDSTTYKHMIWMPADNYQLAPACPLSMVDEACGYENLTGTVIILFSRLLCCPGNAEVNALQMRPGERWVMGFLLELWYQKELDNRVDGWPKKTYGTSSNDSSWWPKLCIDLTNQPVGFPPNQEIPNTLAHTISFMTTTYGMTYGRKEY